MRKLLIAIIFLVVVAVGGVKRFDYLATKPMDPDAFSLVNKVEIYTGYLAMTIAGYPLYPEISIEMYYMLLPSSEEKELVFENDFFLESKVIKEAIANYSGPVRLVWHPRHYNLGESEARVALALNTGTLHIERDKVLVKVPCTWPRYSDYRNHTAKTPLVRYPEIGVQEGLFWVLEQERWIFPYTAVWVSQLP
jgi:hypothetical protein